MNSSRSALALAQDFLRSTLAAGPLPARQVEAQARKAGISVGTLRRASVSLRLNRTKEPTFQGGWVWEIPARRPQRIRPTAAPEMRVLLLGCLLCGEHKEIRQIRSEVVTLVCTECIVRRERDTIRRIVQIRNEERQEEERCRTIEERARTINQVVPRRLLPRGVDIR